MPRNVVLTEKTKVHIYKGKKLLCRDANTAENIHFLLDDTRYSVFQSQLCHHRRGCNMLQMCSKAVFAFPIHKLTKREEKKEKLNQTNREIWAGNLEADTV